MKNEMNKNVTIKVPPNLTYLKPTKKFISSYAKSLLVPRVDYKKLLKQTDKAFKKIIENNIENNFQEDIQISLLENKDEIQVEILNKGLPLFSDQDFLIQNQGRRGQKVILKASRKSILESEVVEEKPAPITISETPEIRLLNLNESSLVTQLFCKVYGYDYVNEFIYYPEQIEEKYRKKELFSLAAISQNKLLAHVGLMQLSDKPKVYEACLGAVDPEVKAKGLFTGVFNETMKLVNQIEMQYCVFDMVTNHDYSQKHVARFNAVDMAIFLGCQNKNLQAKLERLGMGKDPTEMDRYTLLLSVLPRVANPFGSEVTLPNNLGEQIGFLLKPFNLDWIPEARFLMPKDKGEYSIKVLEVNNAVYFDFIEPGYHGALEIIDHWERYLKNGYQYSAIDVPLGHEGLGVLQDIFLQSGFFVSGFIPYHYTDKLAVRYQSIGHTKVSFDEIKLFSSSAKKLLTTIRESYERTV
jgi:hypothetical protein